MFIMNGTLHVDLGRATAISLPAEETAVRLAATTPQWPIMHAVLRCHPRPVHGAAQVNHVNIAYAPDPETADKALRRKPPCS